MTVNIEPQLYGKTQHQHQLLETVIDETKAALIVFHSGQKVPHHTYALQQVFLHLPSRDARHISHSQKKHVLCTLDNLISKAELVSSKFATVIIIVAFYNAMQKFNTKSRPILTITIFMKCCGISIIMPLSKKPAGNWAT